MRSSRLRWLLPAMLFALVVLLPLAAWGQTPAPGEEPDVVRPWTWWLSIPLGLAVVGFALFIALRYVRVSSRFFAREEAPRIPERPRAYAGVNAPAYPAPAGAAQPAPSPAPAAAPAAQPEAAQEASPAEQPEEQPAEEEQPETEEAQPEAEEAQPEAEEAQPEAEEAPAEEAEEAPAEQPEEQPAEEEQPAAEAPSEDEDVYERVLKEQLDKGVSPKVAEGRAKAAAHRARQSS